MKDKIARVELEVMKDRIKNLERHLSSELTQINDDLRMLGSKVILLKVETKGLDTQIGTSSLPAFLSPLKGYSISTLISMILKYLKLEINYTPENIKLVKKVTKNE